MKFRSVLFMFVFLISLISVNALVMSEVKVDGTAISQSATVSAVKGNTLDIRVELFGDLNVTENDVRVKAWIGGYEYDDIEETSDLFNVQSNVIYVKTLELELPEDMDATEAYTLHVDAYSQSGNEVEYTNVFTLMVSPERHLIRFIDTIFNTGLSVEAGQPLFTTVRLENLCDKKEEDIKVKVSIPALGVSAVKYLDELTSDELDNEDEEDSGEVGDIYLVIPKDAETGIYDVVVDAEYNRGHDVESKRYLINIKGKVEAPVDALPGTITPTGLVTAVISVDSETKQVQSGESAVYKIMFANLGQDAKTYTIELSNIDFAVARVDPAVLTINPDQTAEAYVYLSVDKNAREGMHLFNVNVKSGNQLVKEFNLGSDVNAGADVDAKNVLEVVFVVLLVVLIILGIVVIVKRLGKGREPEESTGGQSYY